MVMGFGHQIVQSGQEHQVLVLGGERHQVRQNGFACRVHITDGHRANRVVQEGLANEAELHGSRNRVTQDGGPAAVVWGNGNRVVQHGLDNVAQLGRSKPAHRNLVRQSGNHNTVRVAGHRNQVRSRGYHNQARVHGLANQVSVSGEDNRLSARGCENQVHMAGRGHRVRLQGDHLQLKIRGTGLKGVLANGSFQPDPDCLGPVTVEPLAEGGWRITAG